MTWGDSLPREECAGRRGRATPHQHAEQAQQRYWQAAERIPGPRGARESKHLNGRWGQQDKIWIADSNYAENELDFRLAN